MGFFLLFFLRQRKQLRIHQWESEIIRNSSEGVILVEGEDRIIAEVNSRMCRMFGYEKNEMIGKHVRMLNCPQEFSPDGKSPDDIPKDILQGITENGIWMGNIRNIRKDGTLFWTRVSVWEMNHPHFGKVYVGLHTDITEQVESRESLQKSEELFRRIFEDSPLGLALVEVGNEFYIRKANRFLCTMLGYSEKELTGMTVRDITHPSDMETDTGLTGQMYAEQSGIFSIEKRYITRQKQIIWGRLTVSRIEETGNGKKFCLGMVEDITERRRMEEELRESEMRYRIIADNIPIGISLISPDLEILSRNRQMERWFLGQDTEKYTRLCCPEQDRKDCPLLLCRKTLEPQEKICRIPIRNKEQYFRNLVTPVLDQDGQLRAMIRIMEDQTEYRKSLAALKESEELYRTLVETSPDGILFTDGAGYVRKSNLQAEKTGELSVGTVIAERIAPADQPRWRKIFAGLAQQGFIRNLETGILRTDQVIIPVEINATVLNRENDPFGGIVWTVRNISERIKAEKESRIRREQLIQADRMAALGTMSAGVAHEINNPNCFIMMNTPVLRRAWENILPILDGYVLEYPDFSILGNDYGAEREKILRACENILEGSRRINVIITELGKYSRKQTVGSPEYFDLNRIVENALVIISHLLKKSTDHFSSVYGKDIPLTGGNPVHLEQIIINLVQNACHALTSREQKICVGTVFDKENHSVIIRVEDEGSGILPEDLPHISEPFFTTRRNQGGTGLGLFVSQSLVEEMKGRMEFASESGKGTVVKIILPVPRNV